MNGPRPHHAPSAERGEMILRASGYDKVTEVLADLAAYADREGLAPIRDLAVAADFIHTHRVLDDTDLGRRQAADRAALNATRRD